MTGMKVLGGSRYINPKAEISPELLIRYALSQKISFMVIGCSSPQEVKLLAQVAREFEPLEAEDCEHLERKFRPYARRLAFYRGTV